MVMDAPSASASAVCTFKRMYLKTPSGSMSTFGTEFSSGLVEAITPSLFGKNGAKNKPMKIYTGNSSNKCNIFLTGILERGYVIFSTELDWYLPEKIIFCSLRKITLAKGENVCKSLQITIRLASFLCLQQ